MNNGKTYTAEEMRHTAENLEWNRMHGMEAIKIASEHVIDQLRYAADVVERCGKEIEATSCKDCGKYNGRPCADHDDCGLYEWHNRFVKIIRGEEGKAEEGDGK